MIQYNTVNLTVSWCLFSIQFKILAPSRWLDKAKGIVEMVSSEDLRSHSFLCRFWVATEIQRSVAEKQHLKSGSGECYRGKLSSALKRGLHNTLEFFLHSTHTETLCQRWISEQECMLCCSPYIAMQLASKSHLWQMFGMQRTEGLDRSLQRGQMYENRDAILWKEIINMQSWGQMFACPPARDIPTPREMSRAVA